MALIRPCLVSSLSRSCRWEINRMFENEELIVELQRAAEEGIREASSGDTPMRIQLLDAKREAWMPLLERAANEYRYVEQCVSRALGMASEVLKRTVGVLPRVEALGLVCEVPGGHRHELSIRRLGFLVYVDVAMQNGLEIQSSLLGSLMPSETIAHTHDSVAGDFNTIEFNSGVEAMIRALLPHLRGFVSQVARLSVRGDQRPRGGGSP